MTTIRQLIQTSPTKANELFAKLVDTTESAVKTREKLLADLTEELGVLTQLEEKHLFPVLRKHKQTKNLVADAIEDNRQMRKLLADLHKTPRDSEEFGTKVAALRTAFQLHVRDEKKELLPAVLKALSDEEAQTVIESIEDRRAEIEEEKRSEAEERRAALRQEREKAENVKESAETIVSTLWAGPQAAQQTAQRAQEAARTGLVTVSEVAQRTSDRVFNGFEQTGERAQEVAQQSSETFTLMAEASSVMARGFQDFSQESWRLMLEGWQRNFIRFAALSHCRSFFDLMSVQNEFVRDQLQQTIDEARRLAALATRVADEATQANSGAATRTRQRAA